jgi:hypothetical protein
MHLMCENTVFEGSQIAEEANLSKRGKYNVYVLYTIYLWMLQEIKIFTKLQIPQI